VPRNRRAVMSIGFFTLIVALTGSLVLFLGSAAQAAGRSSEASSAKPKAPPSPLSELLASDAWPGDDFGWSVSISGTTAVVGAPYADSYTGAAYVFSDIGGVWTQEAELSASDGQSSDKFGWSVNISGDTVVVGAPGHYYGLGAAYVFTGSGANWTQEAEFTASDAEGDDKFGYSVVTSGTAVMVGSDNHDAGAGAVYVYDDIAGTWTFEQELAASDAAPSDMFGWSMALSGTTLVVSAVKAHNDTGADYVFINSGGTWTQEAEVYAADGAEENYFGDKVATNGTVIVAGAPGHDDEQGAAYVFDGAGANWKQVAELTASDGGPNDCFGWAVGLSGKTVLVGAEQTHADSGAAYVYTGKGAKWRQKDELTGSDGGLADEFGYSASLSGTTAIVSADQAEADAGMAFIYKV
jgi:uncharacterized protein (DUF2345 family)